MSGLKLLRKEALLRNTMIITVIACVIFISYILYLRLVAGKHFIRLSTYHVSIPSKPASSGKLYSLDNDNYLLVLKKKNSGHFEVYYINMKNIEIGMPSFDESKYIPLLRSALVDKDVLKGYPVIGSLDAEWKVNKNELRIRVRGFTPKAMEWTPDANENVLRKYCSIAYKEWIVLRKLEEDNS